MGKSNAIFRFLNRRRIDILVVIGFFAYASLMTWPFIIQPTTTIAAPLAGDVSSSITKFDALKRENKNPLVDGHLSTIGVPEGITTNTSVDRVSFFSTVFLWVSTIIFSSVIAHGVFTFLGYFLTGVITYFFFRRVFKSRFISSLGGLIYAAFPLFISLARAAPIYTHMWLYVLPIWAFYNLWEKSSLKRLCLAVASVLPALFWTPYFSFHIVLVGCAVLIVYTASVYKNQGWKPALKTFITIGMFWLLFVAAYYLVGKSSSQGGAPDRTLQEIYDQSLHPLMLVLPGAFTWWGQSGYEMLYKIIPRAYDTNLYMGVTVLLLAAFGSFSVLYRKIRDTLSGSVKIAGYFSLAIVSITAAFSVAPTIGVFGLDIPTPNTLIAHFVPALRAGQRLAMPMMLGVVTLSMIGLFVIIRRYKNKHTRWALAGAISIILLFDISSKPPLLTAQLPQSPVIQQLKTLGQGVVVQYIHGSITGDPGQLPCQLQLIHQKDIVNFCGLEIDYPKGELQPLHKLALLPFTEQLTRYEEIGVKYIIVEKTDINIVKQLQDHTIQKIGSDSRFELYGL